MPKKNMIVPYEGYENYNLEKAEANYVNPTHPLLPVNAFPTTENDVLLDNYFPGTGRKGISDNGADKIWWHYPIMEVGSYKQITNNILHSKNPDEGTCMPASMCGALYKDKPNQSNYIKPLPPVNNSCGTRVGYFTTNSNLLPFKTELIVVP